jgi:hypothetical protein
MVGQDAASNILETIKLIGGLAGLTALGFKIFEEMNGYLKIKIEANNENDRCYVRTEIENTSKWSRKNIDNAFIIVSPGNGDLIESGQLIAQCLGIKARIENTNDFGKLISSQSIYYKEQYAFIPLDFYYSENIAIGDEKLTYCCSIDNTQLQVGCYSVRFYIYQKNRYHRSTQDLMMIMQD